MTMLASTEADLDLSSAETLVKLIDLMEELRRCAECVSQR